MLTQRLIQLPGVVAVAAVVMVAIALVSTVVVALAMPLPRLAGLEEGLEEEQGPAADSMWCLCHWQQHHTHKPLGQRGQQ